MSVYKNQSKFEFRPTRKQYFEICIYFFKCWHNEKKKIKQGTSLAKLKKINRRCVTEKTCDAKRLLQELCDRFKVISVKFLFYFDQKEASPPCGHIYGHNLQLDRNNLYQILEDLVVFDKISNPTPSKCVTYRSFGSFEYHKVTFYKINFLMVFIKQAGGSNLGILLKVA